MDFPLDREDRQDPACDPGNEGRLNGYCPTVCLSVKGVKDAG